MKRIAATLLALAVSGCAAGHVEEAASKRVEAEIVQVDSPVNHDLQTHRVRIRQAAILRTSRSAARRALARLHARHAVDCSPNGAEQWIIAHESGGDVHNWNPVETSTGHAFGIGQLTDENRYNYGRALGINPNSTNFCDQLRLMRAYVADRYGNSWAALDFWRAHGYY